MSRVPIVDARPFHRYGLITDVKDLGMMNVRPPRLNITWGIRPANNDGIRWNRLAVLIFIVSPAVLHLCNG